MASYSRVIAIGNLTRDIELRYTPQGAATCQIGMAVNRKFKTEAGVEKEEVCFFDVIAWGKQAEVLAQYLKKGDPLFVEGRLKLEEWDDKTTGKRVSKLRVQLENFQFLGGKRDGEARPAARASAGPRTESDDASVPF